MEKVKATLLERLDEVKRLVNETNKSSVLVIQQFPVETDFKTLIPHVRESISNILAFVELGEVKVLQEVLTLSDGVVDNIIIDADIKCSNSKGIVEFAADNIKKSKSFYYSDNNTWADSAIKFLLQISKGVHDKRIVINGEGLLHDIIFRKLTDYSPELITKDQKEPVDIIIGSSTKKQSIDSQYLHLVDSNTKIYDVGIGNFTKDFLNGALDKGAGVYRIDIRAGISSTVLNILETDYLITNVMGSAVVKDTHIVAGGEMGTDGSVIVDGINNPTYVIGIADGEGNIKNELSDKDLEKKQFIERLINPW